MNTDRHGFGIWFVLFATACAFGQGPSFSAASTEVATCFGAAVKVGDYRLTATAPVTLYAGSSITITYYVTTAGSAPESAGVPVVEAPAVTGLPASSYFVSAGGGAVQITMASVVGLSPGAVVTFSGTRLDLSAFRRLGSAGSVTVRAYADVAGEAAVASLKHVAPAVSAASSPLRFKFSAVERSSQPFPQPFTVPGLAAISAATPVIAAARTESGEAWLRAYGPLVPPSSSSPADAYFEVAADTTGLQEGAYRGFVDLKAYGEVCSSTPVILEMRAALFAWPIQPLSLSAQTGLPFAGEKIAIGHVYTPPFQWNITPSTTAGGNWLTVSPASGSQPTEVTVGVNTAGLAPGSYQGSLSIAVHYSAMPVVVPVSLVVTAPPTLAVSPSAINIAVQPGQAVSQHTLVISNTGGGLLPWAVNYTGPGTVRFSPRHGVGAAAVLATVDASSLPAGQHPGTIVVSGFDAVSSPRTIPVNLNLQQLSLQVNPAALSFSISRPTDPDSRFQTVAVSSPSPGLAFSATASSGTPGWLSVSPGTGVTPATIRISVEAASLPTGTYSGTIQVAPVGFSALTIPVSLVISAAPAGISLSSSQLQFITPAGVNPPPQSLGIQNSGAGTLRWSATVRYTSGAGWLAISPGSGDAPSLLTVTPNSATLPAGTYRASIVFSGEVDGKAAPNSPQSAEVTLAVGVPVINSDGIVNGASFSRATAPGSIISIFGKSLASVTEPAKSLPLPTTLAGSQVLVDGKEIPLFFVSGLQINALLPLDLALGDRRVEAIAGGYRATSSVRLEPAAPGIFTANDIAYGHGAVVNSDFSANTPANPAKAGSVIQIYATGLGRVTPAVAPGHPAAASPLSVVNTTPKVFVGGIAAEVLFAGLAPGFVGLYQVNARIPESAPAGAAVPLWMESGAQSSNTVTLAVAR